ncbi:Asp-tRNA(Asn)/Glu-tRNA(Gln) amidotransferase subunit GatA [Candidatus Falkowbacteria bacterium]|nr:Asp-tRNA(Asn)/Glu-tRNA(Gln) amidotransferase subunit GatA [Candidatus Falkowbacteria bacterium]MBT4433504.1 Asp-tRNA(Asn)/Glu-tRNA(Gln) amidotransferase subunit GatA [Candidatus Falkowbacteria bacterium]
MLTNLTIKQAHKGLKNKEFSAEELVNSHIKVIQEKDKDINAFVLTTFDLAREQAKKVDSKIKKGEKINLLEGIPVSIKDCFCTKGIESTASSNILKGYVPPFDATSVRKIKEQGAIILGKVNTDEFTMGASTETSAFGVTKNSHDLKRVSGGSSGGSAASVASQMAMYSLATDTGGSIRQPAAFCGVTGLKVTYGRVSRYGVMSMASSLDTIGPIGKSVEDVAIILEAIAGHDKNDSTTPKIKVDNYLKNLKEDIKGLKIGVPKEYFDSDLSPEIRKITEKAIQKLKDLGCKIKEVSLPHTKYAIAVYYIIVPSEISSNMARYDGIKYGYSEREEAKDLMEIYTKSRAKGFGDEVKRRIMLGTYALSAGYYDAYYKKAMQVRTLIKQDFDKVFESVDALIAPVTPGPAFKIGENINDPLQMYLEDIFTAPVNLAGVPALSVPYGKIDNLPVGVQIIGKHFDEKTILKIGSNLEK